MHGSCKSCQNVAPKGRLSGDSYWIICAAETALLNNKGLCLLLGFWSGVVEVCFTWMWHSVKGNWCPIFVDSLVPFSVLESWRYKTWCSRSVVHQSLVIQCHVSEEQRNQPRVSVMTKFWRKVLASCLFPTCTFWREPLYVTIELTFEVEKLWTKYFGNFSL